MTQTKHTSLILMNRTHEVCELGYDPTNRRIISFGQIQNGILDHPAFIGWKP